MRRVLISGLAGVAIAASANSAAAIDGLVPFNGLITAACVLTVGTPGLLGISPDYKTLSSTGAGGAAGTIAVLTTGSAFRVSTIAPSDFTIKPLGFSDPVTFTTRYQATGATTIGDTPGTTQTLLGAGLTNVQVNLSAVDASNIFTAGNYTAVVTVRCE